MWGRFTFFRLSVAEKTQNQVFRVLTFSTGTRQVKIAMFSLKTFGLRYCLKSSHRLILGSKSMWWAFKLFRLSAAEKSHNQVLRVLQFLPGPRLGEIAIFSLKVFGFRFCLKSSQRLILGSYLMWWSFRFFRLSVAEKTNSYVLRILTFSTGTRLVKIAIFSLKFFGL